MMETPILAWLHDLPFLAGLGAVVAAFVIPTLVGSFLLQPYIARLFRGEREINTILGFLLNAFALYFGVLLALLSIAVFENHNKAEDAVTREAVAIIKLYRDLTGFPEPIRTELASTLHRYVDEVLGPGWVQQQRGLPNLAETRIMNEFHAALARYQPNSSGDATRYAGTLNAMDSFIEARRLRISAAGYSIPRIMWFIVLVGAIINVLVIWMFDLRQLTHAIIGGTLSLFIAMVIYMVAVLDAPFKGVYGVKPDMIELIHTREGIGELRGGK